ncbi:hypothetical protein AB3S75_019402 [Citrus x aurantiifolia]
MASAYSSAINNNTVLRCPIIDLSFDLDDALTMTTTDTPSTPSDDQDQQKIEVTGTNGGLLTVASDLPTGADSGTTEGVCMVCMEDFDPQEFPGKQVPCGHVFHAKCISTWISLSNSCPVCRSRCIISG